MTFTFYFGGGCVTALKPRTTDVILCTVVLLCLCGQYEMLMDQLLYHVPTDTAAASCRTFNGMCAHDTDDLAPSEGSTSHQVSRCWTV